MTFCPQRDFVIEDRFDRHKVNVVYYKIWFSSGREGGGVGSECSVVL